MSGTIQLLAHFTIAGGTLGIFLAQFPEQHWAWLSLAAIFWLVFMAHVADATWIPTWGKGRDWIDRIGIFIRGIGFAIGAIGLAFFPSKWCFLLFLCAIVLMIFGRMQWELIVHKIKG